MVGSVEKNAYSKELKQWINFGIIKYCDIQEATSL